MKGLNLASYKETLEEFLEKYIEHTKYIGYRRSDELRPWLQRKTNLVALIIERVHYEPEYTVRGEWFTFYSVLSNTLQEGASEDQFWKGLVAHVIRIINEGIGNIENNTIILKEVKPVLPIMDQTLRNRCLDLLKAPGDFDRVINQATQVLEARLRDSISYERLCEAIPEAKEHVGEPLANKLLSPNKPVIVISDKAIERAAFHKMVVGIISYLRNPSHHFLDNKTEWSLAWSVVGLIDSLLSVLENSYIPEDSEENKRQRK